MTSSASARPAPNPLPRFDDLVNRLRAEDFRPGVTELVNAGRLLRYIEEQGSDITVDALRARLRVIFCKSREDQGRFDDAFRQWIRDDSAEHLPPRVEEDGNPPPNGPWLRLKTFCHKERRLLWRTAACVLVLGGFVLALWRLGVFSDTPVPNPLRGPAPTASESREAISVKPQVERYFLAGRDNREVDTTVAWGGFAIQGLVLLFLSFPVYVLTSQNRRPHTKRITLDESSLHEAVRHIVPPLAADIAAPLERHVRGTRTERGNLARRAPLHLRRTIEATMRNFGIPQLHFRHTNLRPSYLMLIDDEDITDPRQQLFYMWADRLRLEGLDVDIRKFHRQEGRAPIAHRLFARGELSESGGEALDQLPDPPVGQRLIVVSSGEAFSDEQGRLLPWVAAARFHRWKDRAFFTLMEPRDWGAREVSIEQPERAADPGFIVLPLEEDALRAWAKLLVSGELPNITLSDPQRYPRLLADGKHDFLSNEIDDEQTARRLVAQLKVYLGDNGFQWLAALAVTPVVKHPLTLLIGERFFRLAGVQHDTELRYLVARNYRRLARLPWLRKEYLPDWLRILLLEELPPATQARIREVVESLLQPLSPTAGAGVPIELDTPSDDRGARPFSDEAGDAIYLGYMSGLSARQLAMRAPASWREWMRKRPDQPRERRTWRDVVAAVRAWFRGYLAELAFRGILDRRHARGAMGFVAAFMLLWGAYLLATRWFPDLPGARLMDSERHHPIAYMMRGTLVNTFAFSPSGHSLLTGGEDGRAQNWDVSSGRLAGSTMHHDDVAQQVAFCGNDGTAVTATARGLLQVWDATLGKRIGPARPAGTGIASLACDPAGHWLAVTSDSGAVMLWNVDTLRSDMSSLEPETRLRLGNGAYRAAFAADGRSLLITAPDGLWQWEPWNAGFHQKILPWKEGTIDALISLDGSTAVEVGRSGAWAWDIGSRKMYPQQITPKQGEVQAAALCPDGSQILLVTARAVEIYHTRTAGPALLTLPNEDGMAQSVAFSPDARRFAVGYADRAVLWGGDDPKYPITQMDLDTAHGLLTAVMTQHHLATTLLCMLLIVLVGWWNARRLRRNVSILSAG